MQRLKEIAGFIREYYELYVWLAAVAPTALLLLLHSGLPKSGTVRQKATVYPIVAILCCLLAAWIKDFSLSNLFVRLPYGYYCHLAVKLVLLELIGYWLVKAILYLAVHPGKLDFFRRRKWFFLVLAWLLTQVIFGHAYEYMDSWRNVWYVTDYSLGFGSRFLIGTLCRLLFGEYISSQQAAAVVLCSLLLSFVYVAFMADAVIRGSDREHRPAVIFLLLCLLCSPASVGAMGGLEVFGRMENFTFLVCIIAVLLFVKMKSVPAKYVVLSILGTLCNAIYHGYVFLYFPILLMLMVDDIFAEKEHPWRRTALAAGACVPVGLSFLYFQFFASTTCTNAEEMAALLQRRTDMSIISEPFYYELFAPITESYRHFAEPILQGPARQRLFLTILLVLPVVVVTLALYLKCFALVHAQGQSVWRTPYPWFLLMQLCALPQFLLNVDWGRWMLALGVDLFFGILYLVYRRRTEMLQAMQSLTRFLEQKRVTALMTLLWLAGLGRFKAVNFLPVVNSLWDFIARIIF